MKLWHGSEGLEVASVVGLDVVVLALVVDVEVEVVGGSEVVAVVAISVELAPVEVRSSYGCRLQAAAKARTKQGARRGRWWPENGITSKSTTTYLGGDPPEKASGAELCVQMFMYVVHEFAQREIAHLGASFTSKG